MAEEVVKRIRIQVDGDQAKKELNDVKDSLKETNKNVKDLEKTNLGNFSQSLGGLKDAFLAGEIGAKGLAKGVLQVGKAMFTAFISNPIGIVIAAIVVPFVILYNLFKSFKPVTDVIERSFAAISAVFSLLKNGLTGLISGNVSLKNTFSGLGTEMSKTAKAAYDLAAAQQALDEANQDLELSNAKVQTQIEQLTIQSKNRTITEKERLALFAQIEKVEKDQYEKRKQIADETERIAFEKMIQGKRVTDEEIKNIKELGLAEARRVLESKGLTDEQIGLWQKALIAQEQIAQQHNAIIDKGIIKQDAAIQKQKDDAQKAKDDSIAAAEKAAAKEKEINDKLFAEAVYYYDQKMLIVKAQADADKNSYERGKEIAKFNAERSQDEINRIEQEIIAAEKKYKYEANQLAKTEEGRILSKDLDFEFFKFKAEKENEIGNIPIKYAEIQLELSKKLYDKDKERLEAELNNFKEGTVEKINLTEQLKQLNFDYFTNKVLQEENIAKLSIDKSKEVLQKRKEEDIADFDNKLALTEKLVASQDAKLFASYSTRRYWLEIDLVHVKDAYSKKLISAEEYQDRLDDLELERSQLRKKAIEDSVQAAADTINALSQLNQADTERQINNENKKLQAKAVNGVISLKDQEAYEKKVNDIREKSAKKEKALAIGAAIINTAQSVTKSLSAAPFPFNVVLAAATAALGIAQIRKIASQPTSATSGTVESPSSSSSSSSSSSTGTSPNTSFSFSPTAETPLQSAPIKTYVLNKDVTTSQTLERATIANGTI